MLANVVASSSLTSYSCMPIVFRDAAGFLKKIVKPECHDDKVINI
jgi:hypothetical protein